MADLDKQMKKLQQHLKTLKVQADKARGLARRRMKRIERRTRVKVTRTLRTAEPQVRQAVAEAERVGRGLRAGMRAGAAAYRASGRKTTK